MLVFKIKIRYLEPYKTRKQRGFMFVTFAIACHLLVAVTFDADMSQSDQKKTGLYKLSEKEKTALQQWIDANYQPKQSNTSANPSQRSTVNPPLLQENLQNSNYIRLTDNTLWHVRPEDLSIAQGWITPVPIIVTPSTHPFFSYTLTNQVTGSSVLARKVDQLPPAPKQLPSQTESQKKQQNPQVKPAQTSQPLNEMSTK